MWCNIPFRDENALMNKRNYDETEKHSFPPETLMKIALKVIIIPKPIGNFCNK